MSQDEQTSGYRSYIPKSLRLVVSELEERLDIETARRALLDFAKLLSLLGRPVFTRLLALPDNFLLPRPAAMYINANNHDNIVQQCAMRLNNDTPVIISVNL